MTTKLTLSVEKQVVERAKKYARKSGRSLSDIIETYLESLTTEDPYEEISPKLKSLVGVVKLPKNFDYNKERREYLEKKYL